LLFNSAEFLIGFLPAVLLIYFLLPHRGQNTFLVFASCVFYASWDWRFLLPLICTTSLDYWVSLQLERLTNDGADKKKKRKYLIVSLVANLGLLGFFKYFNFFETSLAQLFQLFGLDVSLTVLHIVLPVAISFYTFQAMSYTIDVYRGELHPTRSFWDFFLAVLYFPHLVAGPIQRAATLIPQVTNPRQFDRARAFEGAHLMLWGYFKKVFIADNLSPIVNHAFAQPSAIGGATVVGVLAFAFQIYCDFSGYTDIARGIAKIMGFEFIHNFNLPYFATNPADFWHRWHISLSSWLRDYLYKPLGGSRYGTLKTYRNIMITMLLGGLWHGAAWNFVLWGFYHGAILVLHRAARRWLELTGELFSAVPGIWTAIRIACMLALTCYGWLLFRAGSLHQIIDMTRSLIHPIARLDIMVLQKIGVIIAPLLIVQFVQWRSGELFFGRLSWLPTPAKVVGYSLMLYSILFLGGTPQSFVYFQF
jgi:alginate O-acetyltransferase complex protein AlgI